MLDALVQSLYAVFVLMAVASFGYITAGRGWYDKKSVSLVARLVNLALPFFLFSSVTTKFTHDEFMHLMTIAVVPFMAIAIDYAISWGLSKTRLVREDIRGVFIASFTPGSILFIGIPLTLSMFGEEGIPYLLVYFFANVVFVWTIGQYNIQLDGCRRHGNATPQLFSVKGLKMLFKPPMVAFLIALAFVVFAIPVPKPVAMACKLMGQMTSPLALVFIGITIYNVGFAVLKNPPRELVIILLACYVIRPLVTYLCSLPFDMDPLMRQVFVVSSTLATTSVIGVLSRQFGADDAFASEAVGATTAGLVFALPVILIVVNFIH